MNFMKTLVAILLLSVPNISISQTEKIDQNVMQQIRREGLGYNVLAEKERIAKRNCSQINMYQIFRNYNILN